MKIDLAINVSKAFGELVSFFSISNRKLRWNLHTLFKNCFHLTNCRSCNYLRWKKNIVNCKQSRYCSFIFHTSSQLNKQSIKWKRISHDSTRIWNDASTSSCKRVNIDWLLIHRWKITLESSSVNIDLQVPTSRVIFLCSDIIYCNKLPIDGYFNVNSSALAKRVTRRFLVHLPDCFDKCNLFERFFSVQCNSP